MLFSLVITHLITEKVQSPLVKVAKKLIWWKLIEFSVKSAKYHIYFLLHFLNQKVSVIMVYIFGSKSGHLNNTKNMQGFLHFPPNFFTIFDDFPPVLLHINSTLHFEKLSNTAKMF